jgi:sugar transferase (PEP-CTERM/EpsH1 system associated)
MRILWVKAGGLVPPDTGGKIRSYQILRQLARDHSVVFFTFYGKHSNDLHPSLASLFDRAVCIPLDLPHPKSLRELVDYGANLLTRQPYNIAKYCRSRVRTELRRLLERETFDTIICDFLIPAAVIPWDWPTPKVLFTHNVESMIWKRHYDVARNPLWKLLSWREWRTMQVAEQKYLLASDHVLAVSQDDCDFFAKYIDHAKISLIPTGADTDYFQPIEAEEIPNSLVFTGSMDWLPNEDAIIYFVKQILPKIREQIPDVSLAVVGRNPSRRLQELVATENAVRLTGWVEDIRPFLAKSTLCLVPLRIGGGTRLKIFEAMSMGKAVVSTSIGAEGLPVQPGKHLVIADDPTHFASATVNLLRDPASRRQLGIAARRLVEEKYSWAQVAKQFAKVLQDVVLVFKSRH